MIDMTGIDPQLKQIVTMVRGEDIGKLEGRFVRVLGDNPVDINSLYGMGILCWRTGRREEAVRFLEKVLKNLPVTFPEIVEVRFLLAQIFFDLKAFDRAIPHAEYLLEQKIYHPVVYVILCHSFRQLGNIRRARYYLNRGLKEADGVIEYQPGLVPVLTAHKQVLVDGVVDFRRRRDAGLAGGDRRVVLTWAPACITETSAELRGATRSLGSGVRPAFELSLEDHMRGDMPVSTSIEAKPVSDDRDNANGVAVWRADLRDLEPGRTYRYRLILRSGGEIVAGDPHSFSTKVCGSPDVITGAATPVGVGGFVINGAVGGTTLPTAYFFMYGSAADALEGKTPVRHIPPPRSGCTRDVVSHALDRIIPYTLEAEFPKVKTSPLLVSDSEMPSDLALRITTPFGKDRNHVDGIGAADLVMGWSSIVENPNEPAGANPGRKIDLRDAEVEICVRCHNFDSRDSYFALCCQSSLGTACTGHMEDTANWCLTGQMTEMRDHADGQWHSLCYRFRNDSEEWTYAGNNPEEQGKAANRYAYRHIDDVLSCHRGNICFWFIFGDERDTCEGALDVYSLSLRYRDASLLSQGWNARLIDWPSGAVIDPARLTDGWRGDPDRFWLSGPNPGSPQEFVWDFGTTVEIESIRLHQNTLYPSKDIDISCSMDGETFETVCDMTLPLKEGREAANSRTVRLFDPPATVRFLKLGILSGYQSEFWGLDAIEVFGKAGPPAPEIAPCSISEELAGLTPGKTLYYRLVAENETGVAYGDIHSVKLPSDRRPVIHRAKVLKQEGRTLTLLVRLTAMGNRTRLRGGFENGSGAVIEGPVVDAGCQSVPRHMTYRVSLPDSWEEWRGHLTAVNGAGESEKFELAGKCA